LELKIHTIESRGNTNSQSHSQRVRLIRIMMMIIL